MMIQSKFIERTQSKYRRVIDMKRNGEDIHVNEICMNEVNQVYKYMSAFSEQRMISSSCLGLWVYPENLVI